MELAMIVSLVVLIVVSVVGAIGYAVNREADRLEH